MVTDLRVITQLLVQVSQCPPHTAVSPPLHVFDTCEFLQAAELLGDEGLVAGPRGAIEERDPPAEFALRKERVVLDLPPLVGRFQIPQVSLRDRLQQAISLDRVEVDLAGTLEPRSGDRDPDGSILRDLHHRPHGLRYLLDPATPGELEEERRLRVQLRVTMVRHE